MIIIHIYKRYRDTNLVIGNDATINKGYSYKAISLSLSVFLSYTHIMLLNNKDKKDDEPLSLQVGSNLVTQEHSTKLLGMMISDKLDRKEHFYGKNGLRLGAFARNYPVHLEPNYTTDNENKRVLRPSSTRLWNQDAKLTAAKESFSRSAAKLWNLAPSCIKNALNLIGAKKEISKYCKSLPF